MGRFLSTGFIYFDESRGWNDSVRSGRDAVHDTGISDDKQRLCFATTLGKEDMGAPPWFAN
jgi:hypothetical protein